MLRKINLLDLRKPWVLFCIGWVAIMGSLTTGIQPVWNTFMFVWKVEYTASLVLLGLLAYGFYTFRDRAMEFSLPVLERNLIVFPILAIILWSGLSATWAPSWKSSIHHAFVWSEYVIFFLIVRQLIDEERAFSKLLLTPVLTLAFYAALAVASYLTVLMFDGGLAIGMIFAKYGEQVNTILPLAIIGVVRQTGRRFKIGVAIMALLWLLVFCSISRTNIGLFAIGFLAISTAIFFIPQFRKWRGKMAVIAAAMILVTLPLYLFSFATPKSGTLIENRLSDGDTVQNSNDFRRLMVSLSLEMISAHPVIGIGADNFGFEANDYRAIYGTKNPNDPTLAQAENEIPERAHNEYLQFLAELGAVGGALLLWLLFGIAVIAWRAIGPGSRRSPFAIAAVIGLAMFLASSLVTSYSFRVIQNGFVFFFVLAVASKLTLGKDGKKVDRPVVSPIWLKFGYAAAIAACIGMIGYWSIRVASVAYATSANSIPQLENTGNRYQTAIWLDNENPDARYFFALRLVKKERYEEAIPLLKESIRIGKGTSTDYSYMATAQYLAKDLNGAEATMAEAATLYPRSPFILARYAALLDENGKQDLAKAALERARQINKRAANTWWELINHGSRAASDLAFSDEANYMKVMDLQPLNSMYAVVAERDIRFPDERAKLPFDQF